MYYNRLNKKEKGVYSIEEEKQITNGQYNGRFNHGNIIKGSVMIYTQPGMQGEKVKSFFVKTHPEKSWVSNLVINYDEDIKLYVNYETAGDLVDADDINFLQNEIKTQEVTLKEINSSVKEIHEEVQEKADSEDIPLRITDLINDSNFMELSDITKDFIIEKLGYVPEDIIHSKEEIERIEKMINEIVVGGSGVDYIIPRATNNPIMDEIFYKTIDKSPPITHWYPDDWGVWEVMSQNHLKCKETNQYNGLSTRITGGRGTINIKIVKTNQEKRHMLRLRRNGNNIIDIRETKGDKEYDIKVEPGDLLTITSLFAGEVFLEYSGEISDKRLYVYKNGKEERVANAYLVEKTLENYPLKEEVYSLIGNLDELQTTNKGNLVDSINEILKKLNMIIDDQKGV